MITELSELQCSIPFLGSDGVLVDVLSDYQCH